MTQIELESNRKKIGKRIKDLRVKAGYTSGETFAQDKGFSRKGYWALENGSNFRIDTLQKILAIHQITMVDFFKGLNLTFNLKNIE